MIKRKLITIYYKNRNQVVKFLSQIGVDVEYTSKKGAYLIAYFNDSDQKRIINSLKKNPLVVSFDISDKVLAEIDIDRKTVPVEETSIEEEATATPYMGLGEEGLSENTGSEEVKENDSVINEEPSESQVENKEETEPEELNPSLTEDGSNEEPKETE